MGSRRTVPGKRRHRRTCPATSPICVPTLTRQGFASHRAFVCGSTIGIPDGPDLTPPPTVGKTRHTAPPGHSRKAPAVRLVERKSRFVRSCRMVGKPVPATHPASYRQFVAIRRSAPPGAPAMAASQLDAASDNRQRQAVRVTRTGPPEPVPPPRAVLPPWPHVRARRAPHGRSGLSSDSRRPRARGVTGY